MAFWVVVEELTFIMVANPSVPKEERLRVLSWATSVLAVYSSGIPRTINIPATAPMLPAPRCGFEEKKRLFCLTSFYLLFTMYDVQFGYTIAALLVELFFFSHGNLLSTKTVLLFFSLIRHCRMILCKLSNCT